MTTHTTNRRRDACNLRIKDADILLIDRAADARGVSRLDFIVDAAREAAQSTLDTGHATTTVTPAMRESYGSATNDSVR